MGVYAIMMVLGSPLPEGEGRRGPQAITDQRELLHARTEEGFQFWMGSLPHAVRRTEAASPNARLFRDVWWGTHSVPGTFAPVLLVVVMLSVASLAMLVASTVHVREPDQEEVDAEKPLSPRCRPTEGAQSKATAYALEMTGCYI